MAQQSGGVWRWLDELCNGKRDACEGSCSFDFFFQAEDGIRDLVRSRGLGDVYKRQILSILSGSELIYGVTIAGFTSAFRQIVWLRKVPLIDKNDLPPDLEISKNEN